jgi:hypothetical protein
VTGVALVQVGGEPGTPSRRSRRRDRLDAGTLDATPNGSSRSRPRPPTCGWFATGKRLRHEWGGERERDTGARITGPRRATPRRRPRAPRRSALRHVIDSRPVAASTEHVGPPTAGNPRRQTPRASKQPNLRRSSIARPNRRHRKDLPPSDQHPRAIHRANRPKKLIPGRSDRGSRRLAPWSLFRCQATECVPR